jgi:hypothetical protein
MRNRQNHLALFWLYPNGHREVRPISLGERNMAREAPYVDPAISPRSPVVAVLLGINSRRVRGVVSVPTGIGRLGS